MSRRPPAGLSIACSAVLLTLTACTSDHTDAQQSRSSTSSAESGSATTASTPSSTQPPVQKPPELDSDETLAGRQKTTTGNASVTFSKGKKGDALIVAVRCQGKGTIKVTVNPSTSPSH